MAPPTITEAVVLRGFAFGEADRVLHAYSAASGRIGVVAKGVRRTKSRFGGRLEPFSHVELSIHRGRGELGTVTGASLVRSHDAVRTDPYRLGVGLVGLEAMLRLFTEEEQNDRAFLALTRFLDALDGRQSQAGRRPALDPLVSRSAQAAVAVRLPAASRKLRRVRGGRGARRLSPHIGRRRVRRVRRAAGSGSRRRV